LRKGVLEVCRPSLNLKISFSDDYKRNLLSVWFILRISPLYFVCLQTIGPENSDKKKIAKRCSFSLMSPNSIQSCFFLWQFFCLEIIQSFM
jgi:hypothetical protein